MLAKAGHFSTTTQGAGNTIEVTVGFEPKVILLWWNGRSEDVDTVGGADTFYGFGIITASGSSRVAATVTSYDALAAALGACRINNNQCCTNVDSNGNIVASLDTNSISSTSFTLIITDAYATAREIQYLALGGDDIIDAACGVVDTGGVGSFTVSGLSFQPNCALLFSADNFTSAPPVGSNISAVFAIGVADGTNQWVYAGGTDDASNTMDTASYNTDNDFFAAIANSVGTTVSSVIDFSSFTSDGFGTTTGFPSNIRALYLALNCTNVVVGNSLTRTDGNDITISGLGWKPAAGLVISHCRPETTTTTMQRTHKMSIGAFTSNSERLSLGVRDEDNVADSNVATAVEYDAVYTHISDTADTIEGLMDVKSVDSGGVTFVMDDTDPAAAFFGYILFGPAEGGGGETKSLSDTGTGIDVLSLSASLSRSDSGAGVDSPTLAALLGLSDLSLGGDLIGLSANIPVSDAGSGDDVFKEMDTSFILHFNQRNNGSPEINDTTHNIKPIVATGSFTSITGRYGNGIYLESGGTNIQYIFSSNVISHVTGTISMWINPVGSNPGDSRTLIDGGGWSFGDGIDLYLWGTEQIYASVGLLDLITGNTTLVSGTWYHVVFTYDFNADDYRIYINNQLDKIDTSSRSAPSFSSGTFGIGANRWIGEGFSTSDCWIDEVIILDHVATEAERNALYAGSYLNAISITANIPVPESGIGIDNVAQLLASLSVDDVSSAQDLITISATLAITDEGFGTDSLSILQSVLKAIADTALATDTISISATLSTTETALGQDALSLSVSFSLSDTAFGIDNPELSALLGLTDNALGGDFLDLSAALSLLETGSGADTLNQLLASLSLSEIGSASDLLQLLASLSISDAGSGLDTINITTFEQIIKSIADSGLGSDEVSISVSLSVQDISTGLDALSISVSLTVLDTGTGLDEETVSKVESLLKSISDIASGLDTLSISASLNVGETVIGVDDPAILASLSLSDLAETFESPSISAELSITDTASATDLISILQSILKQITDVGTGSDTIGQISASIPVSETGLGTDQIGQLLAALLVADLGTGTDVIVKYDVTTQIIKISFIIKQNTISFALKANTVGFELSSQSMVTTTKEPTITFDLSYPSISFEINPGG